MLTAVIFFPGMVLHELAHAVACFVFGSKVTAIKPWGPSGASVTHAGTTGWKNFAISLAPFFVNTALAALCFFAAHKLVILGPSAQAAAFYWLGASFAYYAFPSDTDLDSGWKVLWKHYKDSLLLRRGIFAFLFHLVTFPLLLPAWFALKILGLLDAFTAGFAWAVFLLVLAAMPLVL